MWDRAHWFGIDRLRVCLRADIDSWFSLKHMSWFRAWIDTVLDEVLRVRHLLHSIMLLVDQPIIFFSFFNKAVQKLSELRIYPNVKTFFINQFLLNCKLENRRFSTVLLHLFILSNHEISNSWCLLIIVNNRWRLRGGG